MIMETDLLLQVLYLSRQWRRDLDRQLSVHGISETDYLIMLVLSQQGPLNQITLAEQVALTPSAVARIIAPLFKNGLIDKQKHSHDARMSLITLTPTGQHLLMEASVTLDTFASQRLAALDVSQKHLFSVLLKPLCQT